MRVSVVIPTQNRAALLPRALRSCLAQEAADLEVVIVDDHSTDDTEAVVAAIARSDPRVRLVQATGNGAQAARNQGIRAARGAWIAFLDSDDEWLSNSLDARLRRAAETGADVVHSDGRMDAASGLEPIGAPCVEGVRPLAAVLAQSCMLFPSLLVRRELLERTGLLNEDVVSFQEWDTAIRLAHAGTFSFLPEMTFHWHRQGDSMSSSRRRTARGYAQVVGLHQHEILTHLGRKGLVVHTLMLARLHREAQMPWAAVRDVGRAFSISPSAFTRRVLSDARGRVRVALSGRASA